MIGAWRTPDGQIHIVDDEVIEHIEHAYEQGWLDPWLEQDPMPEDDAEDFNDDPYYEWLNRMKQRLFDQGYVRSRLYSKRDGGDLSIQGNREHLTRPIIAAFLKAYNLDRETPLTIEDGNESPIIVKGTYRDIPSDGLIKDVYFKPHLIKGVMQKYG